MIIKKTADNKRTFVQFVFAYWQVFLSRVSNLHLILGNLLLLVRLDVGSWALASSLSLGAKSLLMSLVFCLLVVLVRLSVPVQVN